MWLRIYCEEINNPLDNTIVKVAAIAAAEPVFS
jgi:hypothetical protein